MIQLPAIGVCEVLELVAVDCQQMFFTEVAFARRQRGQEFLDGCVKPQDAFPMRIAGHAFAVSADLCLADVASPFGTEMSRDFVPGKSRQERAQSTGSSASKRANNCPSRSITANHTLAAISSTRSCRTAFCPNRIRMANSNEL